MAKKEPIVRRAPSTRNKSKQPLKEESSSSSQEEEEEIQPESEIYYQLSDKEMKEINRAFDANMDSDDCEEQLTQNQVKTALRALGFEPRVQEIKQLITKFGNKKKLINRQGFHKIMALKYGTAFKLRQNSVPGQTGLPDEIQRVFELLDTDKCGMITLEGLRSIADDLNENLNDEELLEMIEEADTDGDGKINQFEFYEIMKRTGLY